MLSATRNWFTIVGLIFKSFYSSLGWNEHFKFKLKYVSQSALNLKANDKEHNMYVKLYITRLLIWFSLKEMSVMSTSKMFCSKFMRVTPPSPLAYCVPPYFGLAYCVPLFLASHTVYCLTTKNNHFGRFHLHKEDKITVCFMHMYVQSFLKTLSTVFLLVRLTRFWPPNINV